ncbi:MAG: VCBS repeat-containing protein [Planctomycetes bacterium]|nr:VCBS repeat-containing protein [Planctomycetota bacterium]
MGRSLRVHAPLLGLVLVIGEGCHRSGSSIAVAPPLDPIVDALVLNIDDEPDLVLESVSGDEYIFRDLDATAGPSIEIGTIVTSAEGAGYLRRVDSLSIAGDRITTRTSPAALVDALVQGELHSSCSITAGSTPAAPIDVVGEALVVDLAGLAFGDAATVTIPEGSLSFDADLELDLRIEGRAITEGVVRLRSDVALDLRLDVESPEFVVLHERFPIGPVFEKRCVQMIGAVPLVAMTRLQLVAEVTADLAESTTITTGATLADSVTVGVMVSSSQGWSAVGSDPDAWSPKATSVDLAHTGTLRLSVRPEFEIRFDDRPGVSLDWSSEVRLDTEQRPLDLSWELVGALSGRVNAWGDGLDPSLGAFLPTAPAFARHVSLASGAFPFYADPVLFAYPTIFPGAGSVQPGGAKWIDIDADGDLDALVGGDSAQLTVYRNLGDAGFDPVTIALAAPGTRALEFADFDFDGRIDVLVSGSGELVSRSVDGTFTTTATAIHAGADDLTLLDLDGDGDLDVAASSSTVGGVGPSQLYRNDGNGTFTPIGWPFPDLVRCDLESADFDNDGDDDLLLCGAIQGGGTHARLWVNDGTGTFSPGSTFEPVVDAAVAFGNCDNDADLDLVISGTSDAGLLARVYRNYAGNYALFQALFSPFCRGSFSWGDFDNNGRLDLIGSGSATAVPPYVPIGRLWRNFGGSLFEEAILPTEMFDCAVDWGDFDGDGDAEMLHVGRISETPAESAATVYRTYDGLPNSPPSPPSGLTATVTPSAVTLAWGPGIDDVTPYPTYEIRVGTTPGAFDRVIGLSDPESGLRRVPVRGHAGHSFRRVLRAFPSGTYYWSVQAIDDAHAGSAWAVESTFVVP